MRKKNELPFLKALMEKSGRKNALASFFPEALRSTLKQESPTSFDYSSYLTPGFWAKEIHYSWFFEVVKEWPKEVQKAVLSVLPSHQSKGLAKLLDLSPPNKAISAFVVPFFLHYIKKEMMKEEILPKELLPFSEMNALLDLSKKELVLLIDFLGIYDLAQDLRQVVDKAILEKIYSALSQEMVPFLQYAAKQPVKWVSPKLNLQNWDGTKKQLNHILHQRGLFRLARAILEENPHFQWHLFHHLDTGRAKIMENALKQKIDSALGSYFKKQVLDLLKRVKK